jgi:hypothetical protein
LLGSPTQQNLKLKEQGKEWWKLNLSTSRNG